MGPASIKNSGTRVLPLSSESFGGDGYYFKTDDVKLVMTWSPDLPEL